MSIFKYTAADLFTWLTDQVEINIVDVRNSVDFARFKIESPYPFSILNISYFDFMEIEEESVAKIPKDLPVRVVCAKEGSAQFVAEILERHGFSDVGYLEGGIKSWGNLLVPTLVNPGEEYQIYQFIRPGKASCSYGLFYGDNLMLFDPSRNVDFYLTFAKKLGAQPRFTLETHLQADYIAGSRELSNRTGAKFLANEHDFEGARFDYVKLQDGQQISFSAGGPKVRVAFTPGHTPGSTSYIIDEKYMICGDTIFIDSIGRPDLGGQVEAWAEKLYHTLAMIKTFDKSLLVLPGHYMSWMEADDRLIFAAGLGKTIERNKSIYNTTNQDEFLAFIKSNMRKQPDEYATIRRINANLEQVDDEKAEELDLGKNECAASAYAAA
jgi:glyoxylase-like metal-dependent hydrolase (beta-lactamase superfamily II)